MSTPLFYPLVVLMMGMILGSFTAVDCFALLSGALAVLLMLLIAVRRQWSGASFGLILIFVFMVGVFNIQRQQYLTQNAGHILHRADQGQISLEGIVLDSAALSPLNSALVVQCQRMIRESSTFPVTGNIRLVTPANPEFLYGDFIRFHAKIRTIQSFHNPGGFDYQRYLHLKGIFVSGYVADQTGLVLIRSHAACNVKRKLVNFRQYLKILIDENAPAPQRDIIEAMIIGNQKGIPQDIRDNFAKTGTSHMLAISGLHIGIVAASVYFLMMLLMKSSEWLMLKFNIIKLAALATIIPVFIYAIIAGMGTTALRAAIMAAAVLAALLIGKPKNSHNILFGAALIILTITPESLFEISFQLSFSAVFAILYIVPKFSNWMIPLPAETPPGLQRLIQRIYLFVLVSMAATLGTLPIIVFYFNRISVVTLFANLMIVPLLGAVALIPAMALIPAALISPWLAGFFIKISSFFTGIALQIIDQLASLSWSSFHFVKPTLPEIALFYLLLFCIIQSIASADKSREHKSFTPRRLAVKIGCLIVIMLLVADGLFTVIGRKYNDDLKLTAIDVGQGASTLVQFPRGVNMLIDGGGFHDSSFDMGRSVIAPFLYAQRIKQIDIVVLTHPHPDHLQGLIHILNNFDVKEIWCTGAKADNDLYRLWEKTLGARKIRIRHLSAQSPPETISGVRIHCLWPLNPIAIITRERSYDDLNDSSLVLKITYGLISILITGDISGNIEASLVSRKKDLKSNVVFMPHHGSASSNSDEFIRAVAPQFAIASSGKRNVFRHPHPAVLDRYRLRNAKVFRTDQQGAIFLKTDGKGIEIDTWRKP